MRIWLDTDIGSDVDDALTLGYVLRHDDLELVGVSTVFGDVALRSDIARTLLTTAGASHVPVLDGLGVPLTEGRHGLMFGHEGRGLSGLREPQRKIEAESGGEARMDALAGALAETAPDVIVAIGPLTNLGALARRGVVLPRLAIMGGKIADVMLEGMIPAIPEWNWFCDPLAVQEVLAAPTDALPLVVPAEVTFRTALAEGDVEKLALGDGLARQLSVLSLEWLRFLREKGGAENPRVALHDPLTAATLVRDDLCPFEDRRIRVDDDAASHVEAGEPNVSVATDVDVTALRDHLMETWL